VLTLKVHRFFLLLLPDGVLCDGGRGRSLVQEQRHGLCLLRLGHQHCVAAQHHGLVLHLPRVRDAVGYPVQQIQVSWPSGLVVHMHHPDALRADGQPHLGGGLNQIAIDR
uniref:Uncharacterized protein n=1 Tax=Lates calcarifer TaxID=8187 RepID=A0A4W6DT44_LATCA